ncbi:MAG: hypothetical protein KKE30_05745 [Gammaproteobacteria bacterium]|nr:hypothetical protein [Gammaproteobacteria bacterium]MBU1557011.1 hypothetical protein [Gammaproteobacteria bacterium]MBU2069729.1 hypothetical protein [Gammaproteobacteria bacterium]MBU2184594.1 hypothetical protein [Gammaproteobacteria bacterium]MBU2205276.1 hypothetical protein [Gammaproteobacteria bacterium]
MTENLAIRITKMVIELHRRGYTSLYLYPGMSASGMNWRFQIGHLIDGKWPSPRCITTGSIRTEDEVVWAKDNSSVGLLADGFESYFSQELEGTKSESTEYSIWFDSVVDGLDDNEVLAFYADYDTKHKHLLKIAPGYNGN